MVDSEDRGRQASIDGFSHELIAAGILMKRYRNVSLVDLPLSRYDIIIVRETPDGTEDIIRAQVKTATKSVSFTGGSRGGVDRLYISDEKVYIQSPKISDAVVGLHVNEDGSFDLYFIPTILIEKLSQKSISISKIKKLKNNWEIFENCKNQDYVFAKCKEYGIL